MSLRQAHARWRAGLALLVAASCGEPIASQEHDAPIVVPPVRSALPPAFTGVLAFVGVGVVDPATGQATADQTVVVRDGVITDVGARDAIAVPDDAQRITAAGAWLMPGLVDAHVHLRRAEVPLYVRAGITTVRNMWGHPGIAALRAEAAAGAEFPTIISAGPGIDGPPAVWPYTELPATPDEAAATVTRQAAEGWDYIKVYDRLSPAVYQAIVQRARELGIAVIGHVPWNVGIDAVLDAGQASIEHLSGYERFADQWATADPARLTALARRAAARGTWNCPTQYITTTLAQRFAGAEAIIANRRRMVLALYEAGVPLLAGTDAGIDVVPAGSLASELDALAAAGLPNAAVLRAATSDAARFFGLESRIGAVKVGMRADLVLLSANPLTDLATLHHPLGTVLRGRWLANAAASEPTPASGRAAPRGAH